ncbi:hypothetical protein G7Y79_00013g035580 [Physcia stellaris]|nr:hypothetical protein G7Y79_00013g035580 [Physcia stellaris]
MPEDTPIDQRSAADPELGSEPPNPKPPKRNRNNRWRNKQDPIQKDWQRPDKDLEIKEEPEDIGSAHGAKDDTSEPSSVNHGGKGDVESVGSEGPMDNEWNFVRQEKLKASPNGGKEEYVAVNSAPNGGPVKAAKGRWW